MLLTAAAWTPPPPPPDPDIMVEEIRMRQTITRVHVVMMLNDDRLVTDILTLDTMLSVKREKTYILGCETEL